MTNFKYDWSVFNEHNWTVFDSNGAQVIFDISFEAAQSYLTPERIERGWQIIGVTLVRSAEDVERVRTALRQLAGDQP